MRRRRHTRRETSGHAVDAVIEFPQQFHGLLAEFFDRLHARAEALEAPAALAVHDALGHDAAG